MERKKWLNILYILLGGLAFFLFTGDGSETILLIVLLVFIQNKANTIEKFIYKYDNKN